MYFVEINHYHYHYHYTDVFVFTPNPFMVLSTVPHMHRMHREHWAERHIMKYEASIVQIHTLLYRYILYYRDTDSIVSA